MASESGLEVFLAPSLFLVSVYLVWFARYPMWRLFGYAEPLFFMLILSYFVVLLLSILFLKKDMKKSLSTILKTHGWRYCLVGIVFACVFQGIWFLFSLVMGGSLVGLPFPSLKGYENYAVYSLVSGFALYLAFAVFGAFVEEVAFRGYVQSRIASRYGNIVGVFVSSLFFSLQHIHIFDLDWIWGFFQMQFIYVFCFGIFTGYLFIKSNEDLWRVFAFHASMNIFNVSLPIEVTPAFSSANQFTTLIGFIFMILLLRLCPKLDS